MLPRVCEPAPADPKFEAKLYREMDHTEVNRRFVADLFDAGPVGPRVIDLGCGPALIPILLCQMGRSRAETETDAETSSVVSNVLLGELQVMGVDNCIEMLELARREIEFAGLVGPIQLEHIDLNDPEGLQSEIADTVICNTVLHHLDDPSSAICLAWKALRPHGRLFIRDLVRPPTDAEVERLVAMHAGETENTDSDEKRVVNNQVAGRAAISPSQLLRQSLHAALTLDEIRQIVGGLGIDPNHVAMTSDRHWTLDCIRPASS